MAKPDITHFCSIPSMVCALLMRNPRLMKECEPDVHGYASIVTAFVVVARHLSMTQESFKSTDSSGFTIIINKDDLRRPEESTICAFSPLRDRVAKGMSRPQFRNSRHDKYIHVTLEIADATDATNNPT